MSNRIVNPGKKSADADSDAGSSSDSYVDSEESYDSDPVELEGGEPVAQSSVVSSQSGDGSARSSGSRSSWSGSSGSESGSGSTSHSGSESGSESERGEGEHKKVSLREGLDLTLEELERAVQVFKHCDIFGDDELNAEQFATALAMLGFVVKFEEVKMLMNKADVNTANKDFLVETYSSLRLKGVNPGDLSRLKDNFLALYYGTCDDDSQVDETGNKYLLASDLRKVLTRQGDKLSDEEADELIRDCSPVYTIMPSGKKVGKIYFEHYRAMLIDSTSN